MVRMKNNNQKVSEITLQETLQNLFNRDEEIKTETDLTYEEEYAMHLFKRTIKKSSNGRYAVQPLFKKDCVPLKNNY